MNHRILVLLASLFAVVTAGAGEKGEWVHAAHGDEAVHVRLQQVDDDRGYLGAVIAHVESVQPGDRNGLVIDHLIEGGAADEAGLKPGDQILRIDGSAIQSYDDLMQTLAGTQAGDRRTVTIERDGAQQTYDVVLGGHIEHHSVKWAVVVDENRPFLGVDIQWLNPQLAEFFGVESGYLVEKVIEDGPADLAGLQAGDVILGAEGLRLRGSGTLHELISRSEPGKQMQLDVERRGAASTFFVTLGAAKDFVNTREAHENVFFGDVTVETDHSEHIKPRFKVKIENEKKD